MRLIRFIALAAVVTLAGFTLPTRPVVAADPFEIYAMLPLTGPVAFFGQEEAKGIAMVESAANKQGGINGRPVKFVIRDNQSNTQTAVSLMGQIMTTNPAIVLEGGSLPTCMAAASLIKDKGPVLFCTSASIPQTPGSFVFAAAPSTVDQVEVGMNYLRLRGFKKVATITATDALGQDFDSHLDGVMANPDLQGVTIVAREHFNPTDISINAQMEHIKSSGAQAIFSYITGTPMGTVLRSLRDAAPNMPIILVAADLSYALMESWANIMPNDVEIMAFPAYAPDAIPTRNPVRRSVDAMYEAMKAAGLPRLEIGAVVQWNQATMAVNALRKLGTNATGVQMREYFSNITGYPGVLGMLNYREVPQTGALKGWSLVVRWDAASKTFIPISKPGGRPISLKK
jgi:branched-chain amino acid transport system substrate-binding protein